jgi:hypothetical protein
MAGWSQYTDPEDARRTSLFNIQYSIMAAFIERFGFTTPIAHYGLSNGQHAYLPQRFDDDSGSAKGFISSIAEYAIDDIISLCGYFKDDQSAYLTKWNILTFYHEIDEDRIDSRLANKGDFSDGYSGYQIGDRVRYCGEIFICKYANSGYSPNLTIDTDYWEKLPGSMQYRFKPFLWQKWYEQVIRVFNAINQSDRFMFLQSATLAKVRYDDPVTIFPGYANLGDFPNPGISGKNYLARNTGYIYIWNASTQTYEQSGTQNIARDGDYIYVLGIENTYNRLASLINTNQIITVYYLLWDGSKYALTKWIIRNLLFLGGSEYSPVCLLPEIPPVGVYGAAYWFITWDKADLEFVAGS